MTVATDDPFHVAVGSLPPLNGTALGLAFAEHYTPNERWRITLGCGHGLFHDRVMARRRRT